MFTLEKKVTNLISSRGDGNANTSPGQETDPEMGDKVLGLEENMRALRDELMQALKDLQDQLMNKIDHGGLMDLER